MGQQGDGGSINGVGNQGGGGFINGMRQQGAGLGDLFLKKCAGLNVGTFFGYMLKEESLFLISDDVFTLYLAINGRHETKEDFI